MSAHEDAPDPRRGSKDRGPGRQVNEESVPYPLLIDEAPDPMLLVDGDGVIQLANQATVDLFGYPREALLDSPIELLVPEASRSDHVDHRAGYIKDPQRRPMGSGLELEAQRADGSTVPVEISLSPVPIEDEVHVMATIRDVTERLATRERLAEVERQAEIERLEEINRFKTAFINTAAHELSTPMTPILFQLEILRSTDTDRLSDRQREALDILSRSFGRLRSLIGDVLDGARLQAGQLEISREPVEVRELAVEAVTAYEGAAADKDLTLEVEVPEGLVAHTDEERALQILYNLLSNAVKYTQEGGRILVTAGSHEDGVHLEVRDTGPGLTEAQTAQVFQPFTRVHEGRIPQAGTGLGLYISRGLAERLDGTLICTSGGPGEGTTFHLVLPGA